LDLLNGRVYGQEKPLIEALRLTPVIQLVQNVNRAFRVSLEKLQSLVSWPPSPEVGEYTEEAGKCADLLLGKTLRV